MSTPEQAPGPQFTPPVVPYYPGTPPMPYQQQAAFQPMPQGPYMPPPVQQPPKKPVTSRWWFWVLIGLVALIVLIVAISGGGKGGKPAPGTSTGPVASATEPGPTGPAPTQPVPTKPAPVTSPAATVASDYVVTIDGASQVSNYEGKPALLVDFTFTNNSSKAVAFIVAVEAKAFQNGVQLDTTFSDGLSDTLGDQVKEIKPGATIHVKEMYLLDDTSDVTVEVTEWLSLGDDLIATATFPVQ